MKRKGEERIRKRRWEKRRRRGDRREKKWIQGPDNYMPRVSIFSKLFVRWKNMFLNHNTGSYYLFDWNQRQTHWFGESSSLYAKLFSLIRESVSKLLHHKLSDLTSLYSILSYLITFQGIFDFLHQYQSAVF